jgi:hypothetical protein
VKQIITLKEDEMKYMLLFVSDKTEMREWEKLPEAVRNESYARIGHWFEQNADKIVGGDELQPDHTATTVRFASGKPIVTDGPFLEAKETIGGYAIAEVADLDEALALAKTWPGQGTVELRPVVGRAVAVPASQ